MQVGAKVKPRASDRAGLVIETGHARRGELHNKNAQSTLEAQADLWDYRQCLVLRLLCPVLHRLPDIPEAKKSEAFVPASLHAVSERLDC